MLASFCESGEVCDWHQRFAFIAFANIRMIRRMIRLVAVAALLLSVGGHWALIQSAAWAGMLINFAKQGSLRSAVEKTFDGRHACSLCEWVEHEQQNERDSDSNAPDTKAKVQLYVEVISRLSAHLDASIRNPIEWGTKVVSHADPPDHSPPRAV